MPLAMATLLGAAGRLMLVRKALVLVGSDTSIT
jgi:hypothetical protein